MFSGAGGLKDWYRRSARDRAVFQKEPLEKRRHLARYFTSLVFRCVFLERKRGDVGILPCLAPAVRTNIQIEAVLWLALAYFSGLKYN